VSIAWSTPAISVEQAELELPSGARISADAGTIEDNQVVRAQGVQAVHDDLTIIAETTRWSMRDSTGVFEGGVAATQGDLKFSCERVDVQLDGAGKVQRVVATGHVQVEQGGRTAEGGHAVFAQGRLVLSGDPVVRHGLHEMRGAEIVFEVGKETIECTSCTMTVRSEPGK